MNYTRTQLARISPRSHGRTLWFERMRRVWKSYLRLAAAIGAVMGSAILTLQYFIILPLFAWLAKRAERREHLGWFPVSAGRIAMLNRQY